MGSCCGKDAVSQKSPETVISEEIKPFSPILPEDKPLPIVPKPSPVKWYHKVGISTSDPLLLIRGYEEEPVVSLEEALKPFDGKIEYLAAQINQAKTTCHYPSEHGLTHDESAAIYLNSMQGDNKSVYEHLEEAWEEARKPNDRSHMVPWFRYLKLLRSALNKLPDVEGEVWQGTANDSDLEKKLRSDSLQFYTGAGFCSTSQDEVKDDLKGNSESRKILAGYKSADVKDVAKYTEGNKKDFIQWPGMKLNKSKIIEVDEDGTLTFHFKGQASEYHSPEPSDHEDSNLETPQPETHDSESTSCVSSEESSIRPISADSVKPVIESLSIYPTRAMKYYFTKHFICPAKHCGNFCNADHAPDHCHGFIHLSHKCSHHCGPGFRCYRCKKHITKLHECITCHWRLCKDCCFK